MISKLGNYRLICFFNFRIIQSIYNVLYVPVLGEELEDEKL